MITYRIQLTPSFGFDSARDILAYIKALGATYVYLSPILEARRGSTHGYDTTDPARVRAEFGGEPAFRKFSRAAHDLGLAILVDVVPNHMAADPSNPWWRDVLRLGPGSRFASFFDIDWEAGGPGKGKLILPVLGRPAAEAIAAEELKIEGGDEREIVYFDRRFPAAPGTARGPSVAAALAEQFYELVDWRQGASRINYRRFFDITDLAGLRMEVPEVFDAAHELILRLMASGDIDGLRIDHVDGLFDPAGYLRLLRSRIDELPGDRRGSPIVIEKIFAVDERQPRTWPVEGTTGYDYLNLVNALFVDPAGLARIEDYSRLKLGLFDSFENTAHACKVRAAEALFPTDLCRVAAGFTRAFKAAGPSLAAAPNESELRRSLAALSVSMNVYRTYIDQFPVAAADAARVQRAADAARERGAPPHPALLRAILGQPPFDTGPAAIAALAAIQRWQQFTGPLAAKGIEDTALYRHIALVSLNEVGGEPVLHGDALGAFHAAMNERAEHTPGTMNTTATHDTKRGEDTRLRISVLSELRDQWPAALDRWRQWHAPLRAKLDSGDAPSPVDESLIYQSMLGIWPADDGDLSAPAERLGAAIVKSAREAKLRTSWHQPDDAYETAIRSYVQGVMIGDGGRRFREDSRDLRTAAAFYGAVHSLSQVVLKVFSPGSPDFYQGAELWDTSLVDPDNRRAVDYDARRAMLESMPEGTPAPGFLGRLMSDWRSGAIKLFTIRRALACRRLLESSDALSEYEPLELKGELASHLCGFARRAGSRRCLVVAPRLVAGLTKPGDFPIGPSVWGNTQLATRGTMPPRWRNCFTGNVVTVDPGAKTIPIASILAEFPVAVLESAAD